jgi:ribosome-associated translation inhibitor RaiA
MAKKKTTDVVKPHFYVSISNPTDLRRTILETARSNVTILKSYERVIALRQQKRDTIAAFNEQVATIRTAANRLQRLLPKYQAPKTAKNTAKVTVEPEVEMPQTLATPIVEQKPITQMDALEAELAEIERKLGSL